MKSTLRRLTVVFVTAILASGSAAFGVLVPPWHGDPQERSTFQEWDFSTDELTPEAISNTLYNPYGTPLLRVSPRSSWIRSIPEDGREGVWPLSGEIDTYIPNYTSQEPDTRKEIWVQLIWKATDVDPFLPNDPMVGTTTNPLFKNMLIGRVDIPQANGWVHSVFVINLWPNPSEEWITVKGDIEVDYLSIDTRCLPEPATVFLLGIGGGILTLTRKKQSG